MQMLVWPVDREVDPILFRLGACQLVGFIQPRRKQPAADGACSEWCLLSSSFLLVLIVFYLSISNGSVQVLRNPARNFDGNYGGAARGDLPAPQPAGTLNQTQKLGAALGIPANRAPPPQQLQQQPQQNGNNHPYSRGVPRGGAAPQPTFTPAQRGAPGGFRGVSLGSGVAIPPPASLTQAGRGRGGRGGAPPPVRGARGGGSPARGGRGGGTTGTRGGIARGGGGASGPGVATVEG
ncbi:hypothetical protein T439DRAFT_116330 [Meredithblackwellia eburnea MCA 4105]